MNQTESLMPDTFDRLMGNMEGLPDVARTKPATIRVVTQLIGDTQTFIIQTVRQRDEGDTIFVECMSKNGALRLVIPPAVSDLIARQRDAITAKNRSRGGKAAAKTREALGIVPGFLKAKKKGVK